MAADDVLLDKLNKAVAACNKVEKTVQAAQAELVSKSKAVGLLLLEAKKLHPTVKAFEAFLKRVNGLKLSRAYDLLKLAGGRTTDAELREEARDRKRRSREKKKLSTPEPKPLPAPDSVTKPHVTESPEISIEQRRADNAALDDGAEELSSAEIKSAAHLNEFKQAASYCLPLTTEDDRLEAYMYVQDVNRELSSAVKKRKAA